jgi:hypothetical protein
MPIKIRRAEAADAAPCGAILYSAFRKLAAAPLSSVMKVI